jgi:hypothetical protein
VPGTWARADGTAVVGTAVKKVSGMPVRDRRDDVVQVARAFLHNYGGEYAKPGLTSRPMRCAL